MERLKEKYVHTKCENYQTDKLHDILLEYHGEYLPDESGKHRKHLKMFCMMTKFQIKKYVN